MTNNQLAENSVIQLLNSVRLARDNAQRADNRVDHSFYYALTIALEELQEHRKAERGSEPVELPLDYLQGHKDGLEWASQLAKANHPETGDWLYDDPIELAKAIRKGPDMPPVPTVRDSEPVAYMTYKGYLLHAGDPKLAEYSEPMPLYADPRPEPISAEPVAWLLSGGGAKNVVVFDSGNAYADPLREVTPLYRHAQPAVDSDFIPKNLDKALGVVGVAIPESREEFNLQAERWIQRLIDRVIRYADEFQEQPAPVVPVLTKADFENWCQKTFALSASYFEKDANGVYMSTLVHDLYVAWEGCRAAMLNPDKARKKIRVIVLGASIGAGFDATASGNSPAQSHGWIPVSERMPEVGVKVLCFPAEDEPIHAVFNGQLWLQDISWSNSDEPIDNVITCNVTHWVPLPASPQEVK